MLKPNAEGDTPILVALKSIRSTLLNKVNGSRPQDQVGVVLYGTVSCQISSIRSRSTRLTTRISFIERK